jgi:hypothetical protein
MVRDDQERSADRESADPSIAEIENRLSAAEKLVDELERKKALPESALEGKIDRYHAEILDAIHRREDALRAEILERLARVESKLQHVA